MEIIRNKPFPVYNPYGNEEVEAAKRVVQTGMLSDYVGRHGKGFHGGKNVQEFEKMWADYHGVKHAVTFNTATTGLISALGAIGLLPGDEVLVIGYSMCISATAPLFYDAIPVFVDIDPDYYSMLGSSMEAKITSKTKAILPVDLFGQSSDMDEINRIAKKHNLKVVVDAAHVPGCHYKDGFAGTFGDVGIFSLNQHKIIHTGEGGVAVTNDDDLALRLRLIRNHGEAVVEEMGYPHLTNMVGSNYRMGEVECAIGIEQLKKLPKLLEQRVALADYLTEKLSQLPFLQPPKVRPDSKHVYYLYPIRYFSEETGISRPNYVSRIRELGIPLYRLAEGYIKPLYLEPIFQKKNAFKGGYPFNLALNKESVRYEEGICPITEKLYKEEMIVTAFMYPPNTKADMDDIIRAFTKAGMQSGF
jgi:dTDP-4-amino-4,6-dideoxygalactose transaminase